MRVWRVVPGGHEAFDGEGTRRFGSRWVPKGLRAIYTSATLSLAALELFVHTDPDLMPADLRAISADIPDDVVVQELALSKLPANWRETPAPGELQALGRSWIVEGKAAILSVPSVVVPTERNYVLSPAHAGFHRIHIGDARTFSFDPRIWKGEPATLNLKHDGAARRLPIGATRRGIDADRFARHDPSGGHSRPGAAWGVSLRAAGGVQLRRAT